MTFTWKCFCSRRVLAHEEFCPYCAESRASVRAKEAASNAALVKAKHQQVTGTDPNKPPPPDNYD